MAICSCSSWSERPSNLRKGWEDEEEADEEEEEEEEKGEEEERKNTPNAGKPVCGLRRRQLGVSAIAELLFWKSLWSGVRKSLAHVEEFLIHQDFWETLHLLRKSQTNDSSRLNYSK